MSANEDMLRIRGNLTYALREEIIGKKEYDEEIKKAQMFYDKFLVYDSKIEISTCIVLCLISFFVGIIL